MSQWKNIGAVVALSITTALAGTGCMAQSADDDVTETEIAAVDQDNNAVADEKTGEAEQAQFGFGSLGFGGCGFGLGSIFSPWFSGLGFGGCWPFGGFGGCGFGGFGGCGGFAGCGLGLAGLGCGFAGPFGWGLGGCGCF